MKPTRHTSLGQRLLVILCAVNILYWMVMASLTVRDSIATTNNLYDVHLARTAKAFLYIVDPDDETFAALPPTLPASMIEAQFGSQNRQYLQYGNKLRYQLWRDDGVLQFRSDNAPPTMITPQLGYSDSTDAQGGHWHNYSVRDKNHGVRVIVSEPRAFRTELVRNMVWSAAAPLLLGLPALLLLLWWSIHRGLHPLAVLSREISKRQADNLTQINAHNAPAEVQPLVRALNDLLARMGQTLDNERRFTDDAAHELRTPLAAIQAQLYTLRNSSTEAQRQQALRQLQLGVERSVRLVNQMLTLARLDPRQPAPSLTSLPLHELAESVCADLALLALTRNQTLTLMPTAALPNVMGNADLLVSLISNLVGNAIAYSPNGAHIDVAIASCGGVRLSVCDDGPGIAPEQRSQVFERFYRIAKPDQPGNGLGLAICQRVAELHAASITLTDSPGGHGLTVNVMFPAVTAVSARG